MLGLCDVSLVVVGVAQDDKARLKDTLREDYYKQDNRTSEIARQNSCTLAWLLLMSRLLAWAEARVLSKTLGVRTEENHKEK